MDEEEVSAIAEEINFWIEGPDLRIRATGKWKGDLLQIKFEPRQPASDRGKAKRDFRLTVNYLTAPLQGGGTSVTTTMSGVVYVNGKRIKLTSFSLHAYDPSDSASVRTCLYYLEDYFVRVVRREADRYKKLAQIHEMVASSAVFL